MAVPERYARYYLENPPSLVVLIILNVAIVLVGVNFYIETMPDVPLFLWPIYADSPTAVALFAASLFTLLPNLGKRLSDSPQNLPLAYLNTIAFVWLFQFGVWTFTALNLGFSHYYAAPWTRPGILDYWGIIIAHLAFIPEAYLIPNYGKTTKGALAAAFVLMMANNVFDYVYGYHPPLRYKVGIVLPILSVGITFLSVFAASHAMDRLE